MNIRKGKSKSGVLLLGMVVVVLLCIWTYSTAFHAFDDDEFQHANVAWLMRQGEAPYADFFEHHLVLYHGLTSQLFRFGDGGRVIFLFRTLSLAAAGVSLLLLYKSGRKLGASPFAALAGIWLLGLTPMFLLKMTEARPEPPAMLAFAFGVWLAVGGESRGPEEGRHSVFRKYWKPIAVGLMAAVMTLLSQKYVIVSLALLFAVAVKGAGWKIDEKSKKGKNANGWKKILKSGWCNFISAGLAFLLGIGLYCLWMIFMRIGEEAFEKTVMLNLGWEYSFSPAGYITEMYLTAGVLVVSGVLGITAAAMNGERRPALRLALLLAGSLGLVLLIPVPHRQSFLPLLAVLALGAMRFFTPIFDLLTARVTKTHLWIGIVLLMLGASSIRVLPEHLGPDNRDDLRRMEAVGDFAPQGPIFDGRRLMFWRRHIGFHPFMHEEVLAMLDGEEYAEEVVTGLMEASLPPVIRDYRVDSMPEAIQVFIEQHYEPTDIDELYGAAVQRERLMPGRPIRVSIPVKGKWRISWKGGEEMRLGDRALDKNETLHLEAGEHEFVADELVWNLRLQRDYGGEF